MLPGFGVEPLPTMFMVWRGYWQVVGVTVVLALVAETVTATGVVTVADAAALEVVLLALVEVDAALVT